MHNLACGRDILRDGRRAQGVRHMRRQTGAALLSHNAVKGGLERAVSDAMGRVQREALVQAELGEGGGVDWQAWARVAVLSLEAGGAQHEVIPDTRCRRLRRFRR